jgi:hypothetical protein
LALTLHVVLLVVVFIVTVFALYLPIFTLGAVV